MVSTDHFRRGSAACPSLCPRIGAAELHRMLRSYPGSQHGMQTCCEAMRTEVQPRDEL